MKRIIVASKNVVKIDAAVEAFKKMFPDEEFSTKGISVSSGVRDQPMSDNETYQGALNRAINAQTAVSDADYWVGLEGGLELKDTAMEAFAWMVILSKDGRMGKARTSTFFLPPKVAELVGQGKELGEADDIVFNKTNSKQSSGAVGLLTHDVIDRSAYYEAALILALIPFVNPELYS